MNVIDVKRVSWDLSVGPIKVDMISIPVFDGQLPGHEYQDVITLNQQKKGSASAYRVSYKSEVVSEQSYDGLVKAIINRFKHPQLYRHYIVCINPWGDAP